MPKPQKESDLSFYVRTLEELTARAETAEAALAEQTRRRADEHDLVQDWVKRLEKAEADLANECRHHGITAGIGRKLERERDEARARVRELEGLLRIPPAPAFDPGNLPKALCVHADWGWEQAFAWLRRRAGLDKKPAAPKAWYFWRCEKCGACLSSRNDPRPPVHGALDRSSYIPCDDVPEKLEVK